MNLLTELWNDELALIVSAELVTIGTLGVLGATVGLSVAATAINEELSEVGQAIRSFDQSYRVAGYSVTGSCTSGCSAAAATGSTYARGSAWKAGSSYVQPDVRISIRALELKRVTPAETSGRVPEENSDDTSAEDAAEPPSQESQDDGTSI